MSAETRRCAKHCCAPLGGLLQAAQRRRLLDLVLPKLRPDESISWLLEFFQKETDEGLRRMLFDHLRPLSLPKHAEVVPVLCKELMEPSSPFRQACAQLLAASAELYPEIARAFEDVLLNDQDVPLVPAPVSDGYLKPNVTRTFDALLAVAGNEMLDSVSRRACLRSNDARLPQRRAVRQSGPGAYTHRK